MTTSNWRKRFDEIYYPEDPTFDILGRRLIKENGIKLKNFIEKEIEAAKQEERDAIVEVIEGMEKFLKKRYGAFVEDGQEQEEAYNAALKDVISHLQTSNKTV